MENKIVNLVTDDTVNEILSDIEDLSADSNVTYEVWTIGYDKDGNITDAEMLLETFEDPDEAVKYATEVKWSDIRHLDDEDMFIDTSSMLTVEVETVVTDDDGSMNVGTIFTKILAVLVEDICITSGEYSIVEDDKLKIKYQLLQDFNKNDSVRIRFVEDNIILTYKIISRVMYSDGDYYHLEFVY